MNTILWKIQCIVCLFAVLVGLPKISFAAIDGFVLTEDGKPVGGATVYGTNGHCCPFVPERVQTNNAGAFHLDESVNVIHIWKDGFRPLAVPVRNEATINVTLQKDNDSAWRIPFCSNREGSNNQIEQSGLRYVLPGTAKAKKERSDEGYAVVVSIPKALSPLILSWGGIVGSPHADDPWILQSTHFSERWMKNGHSEDIGIDAGGETADGLRWRHTQFLFKATASYRPVSSKTAEVYNTIIESACLTVK